MKYNLGEVIDRINENHRFNDFDTFKIKVTPIKEHTRLKSLELAKKWSVFIDERSKKV